MRRQEIQSKLTIVLGEIQEKGGYPIPLLTDNICPLENLAGFDSHMGVIATGKLAASLGVPIPHDCNLFYRKVGGRKLSIKEIVDLLVGIVEKSTVTKKIQTI